MANRLGTALRILVLLAWDESREGLTRGEIRRRLGLPADTEITARIRELRDHDSYGHFDVRTKHVRGREFRYRLTSRERARAKRFLAAWSAA